MARDQQAHAQDGIKEERLTTVANSLVLMSETSSDGIVNDPLYGDLVYTFAVRHWFAEALEHGLSLAEALAEFDRQAFPSEETNDH